MYKLILKSGDQLTYDDRSGELLLNNRSTTLWKPAFTPNGNDEPDFFGAINIKEDKLYDIFGNITPLTKEDDIKL